MYEKHIDMFVMYFLKKCNKGSSLFINCLLVHGLFWLFVMVLRNLKRIPILMRRSSENSVYGIMEK